jgi:V/A-type H+/Na+-transporting ATPase subunit F
MRPLVIASEDTVLGFSFAGVEGKIVRTAEETQQAFEQAMQTPDIGILIITEPIAQMIRAKIDNWIVSGRQPLIIEIPDEHGPLKGRRTAREFVKSAIGVKF